MKRPFIIIAMLTAFTLSACSKFLDVNDNPNVPSDVSEALLLAPLEAGVSQYIAAGNAATLVNQWMQNCVPNQPMPNTANYMVTSSTFDDYWNSMYVVVLNNLSILDKQATANGNPKYAGVAKVLTAYTLGTATALWGDIPYSQGFTGTGNTTPTYDKQEDIYKSIQALLDAAIPLLQSDQGNTPGSDDYYYAGDMNKWVKVAYTLKARYYMHLTKAPGYNAAAQADLALTALTNGMSSNDDDCAFSYNGTSTSSNAWYLHFYNTSTLVLSSRYVDSLLMHADPRLPYLVSKAENTGKYNGNTIGSGAGALQDYSVAGSFYGGIASKVYILNAAEALFLKAEATYITAGYTAAQPVFRQAVAGNLVKLGVDTNSAAAQTFLAKRGVLTAANALQLIIEEKATANFLSIENYTDWRRTGFPLLQMIPNNTVTSLPRRFLYPLNEITANPQALQTAKLTDRVWWDRSN
ncbi:SusD/RagB family nutrient-binding outer membrane lipoprotein [Chitinophaga rhizophila]|uniref:SusD/RagB family nutrient-binding outer membrane lipoprotein n=1 Tax=Chitinophaga rhizophila TaxID=2866212 RepID=A0ABS7GDL0_9BACT|nr:SusD/RagB family nutrient-binding outer membrane lipoprotein [Chitinophaga rhizophila]MBW8685773.1 SusD/RagB family nutrient-binding outer membrane lipoprotein [Chitinophaga rhizophila]